MSRRLVLSSTSKEFAVRQRRLSSLLPTPLMRWFEKQKLFSVPIYPFGLGMCSSKCKRDECYGWKFGEDFFLDGAQQAARCLG